MKYYSSSRKEHINIEDMHTEHLANVLSKDARQPTLRPELLRAMTVEYIKRSRAQREAERVSDELVEIYMGKARQFRKALHNEQAITNILWDALTIKPQTKVDPKVLSTYRNVATAYLEWNETISADALRKLLGQMGTEVHGPTLSRVFRTKTFKQAGYRRSTWEGARGRYINRWELA